MKLNFFCVENGDYLGRGREYVHKLLNGVSAEMPNDIDVRYRVITDDPAVVPDFAYPVTADARATGWWGILQCFYPHIVPRGERCMYVDLDTIAVGDLGDIARCQAPFAMLTDFYHPSRFADGVMIWTAGEYDRVWSNWTASGYPKHDDMVDGHIGGSQYWIETAVGKDNIYSLTDTFPGQIVSYKRDCRPIGRLAADARLLCFHGVPRPHAAGGVWVQKLWDGLPCAAAAATKKEE